MRFVLGNPESSVRPLWLHGARGPLSSRLLESGVVTRASKAPEGAAAHMLSLIAGPGQKSAPETLVINHVASSGSSGGASPPAVTRLTSARGRFPREGLQFG